MLAFVLLAVSLQAYSAPVVSGAALHCPSTSLDARQPHTGVASVPPEAQSQTGGLQRRRRGGRGRKRKPQTGANQGSHQPVQQEENHQPDHRENNHQPDHHEDYQQGHHQSVSQEPAHVHPPVTPEPASGHPPHPEDAPPPGSFKQNMMEAARHGSAAVNLYAQSAHKFTANHVGTTEGGTESEEEGYKRRAVHVDLDARGWWRNQGNKLKAKMGIPPKNNPGNDQTSANPTPANPTPANPPEQALERRDVNGALDARDYGEWAEKMEKIQGKRLSYEGPFDPESELSRRDLEAREHTHLKHVTKKIKDKFKTKFHMKSKTPQNTQAAENQAAGSQLPGNPSGDLSGSDAPPASGSDLNGRDLDARSDFKTHMQNLKDKVKAAFHRNPKTSQTTPGTQAAGSQLPESPSSYDASGSEAPVAPGCIGVMSTSEED
ncbi:hypothetical protein BDP27DRAFT_1444529 [Rhodocollybia butyracea]|uniref:Uncharacterized protein n=1 Tax=Rhodocollybia butyracea TaxID=206335 RepID=A0A9P5Q5G1_9AGAR|nr:hypothetical protein BDP27DRAFT_1444529 [Rhodocollybia butyracea]